MIFFVIRYSLFPADVSLWGFGVGGIGAVKAYDETGDLLNLFGGELVFPGDHPFIGDADDDQVENFPDAATVDPVFVGQVRPYKPLALSQVADNAALVEDCFAGGQ